MASPASIDAFKSLDENGQRTALGAMSPEAKQALLTGLQGGPATPPAALTTTSTGITVPSEMLDPNATVPNSVLGGFVRRGVANVKGAVQTFGPQQPDESALTSIPGVRIAKGLYQGAKQAYGQAQGQYGQAIEAAKAGDIPGAALRYGQAAVTGLSIADPFATGPVTNINQLESEGRSKEALGQGAFDALTLYAGKKMGAKPSPTKTINKLAYATDAESIRPLTKILSDLQETVEQSKSGPPRTVGQLLTTVQDTFRRLDNKFNVAVQGMGNAPINLQDIADALKQKANDMPRAGSAEAQALRNEARLYDGQMTNARELNADRMLRNGRLQGFYNKGMNAQAAALRSNAENMVDEIVADKARDVLYGELDKRFPGQDFQDLKLKESSMKEILGHFKDHVEKLEATQAKGAGEPVFSKTPITTSVHPGGFTPRIHGIQKLLPGRGPLGSANTATASAFEPTPAASLRRAAVLALPVSSLTGKRPPVIPPPPQEQGP